VGLLAILAEFGMSWLGKAVTSKGLRSSG